MAKNSEDAQITNHGVEPIAKAASFGDSPHQGAMFGTIRILGDLLKPAEPLEDWECER